MKYAILALLFLLVASNAVRADGLNTTSSNCNGNGDFLNTVTNLPGCIVEGFFSFLLSGLVASVQGFIDSSFKFLFASPNPKLFCAPYQGVMNIIESLYAIALMGLALMFILRSSDVEGRMTAKKWLENMLIMIILLSFSFSLFQIMLDFNAYLTTSFASETMKSVLTPTGTISFAIFTLLMFTVNSFLLLLTFVTLLLRYLLIPFLLFLFPIAIFLYFIPFTQSWGRTFLKVIATLVFMTALDALVLLGLSSLFNSSDPNLSDSVVKAFAVMLGFGAVGIVNVLLILSAVKSVVFQSKTVSTLAGLTIAGKILRK